MGIELVEMRGFSISEFPLPVVVVNSRDAAAGRIFSMLHELTHIALRDHGLCDLSERHGLQRVGSVEYFCNMVAGAALVPRNCLEQEDIVHNKRAPSQWSNDDLLALSTRYGVSKEVILRRLKIIGVVTQQFYEAKQTQLQKEAEEWRYKQEEEQKARKGKKKDGGPLPEVIAMAQEGPFFVRLVLTSYYREKITLSDVSRLLGIRLKHLARLEARVMGPRVVRKAVS
jgi:Zn-dependent peptidase ImmA (M78 family)